MKPISELIRDWTGVTNRINELMKDKLPRIIGNESVRVVKDNFKLQGYDSGNGVTPWSKRDEKTNKAYNRGKTKNKAGEESKYRSGKSVMKGSVYQASNPLLLQTRNLYNAIKYKHIGSSVVVGVDEGLIPYAKTMNEGRSNIPPRQFIPKPDQMPNQKILMAIKKKYDFEVTKTMKGFTK